MEWWHTVVALFVLLVLEYIRRYARRNAQLKEPGAPPGPPVPTNFINPFAYELHLLKASLKAKTTNMGEVLLSNLLMEAEKYPQGLFQIFLTFTPIVIISHAETVKSLLESNKLLTKSFLYEFAEPWLGTGLLTSTNSKWRSRRKMLTPSFHFEILQEFISVFSEQSEIMSSLIERKAGQKVDIMKYVKNSTLDIICETAMGIKINAQTKNSDYLEAQTVVAFKFMNRCLSPWQWPAWFYPLTFDGKVFFKNLRILHEFTRKVIEERTQEHTAKIAQGEDPLAGKRRKAFLDLLITEQLTNNTLKPEDIREEVDTFMFEGHDTTAMGVGWSLYLIGLHCEVQEKVHEEMDRVFGPDRERPITMDDIKQMNYLEAVIKESQRLYPSVPMIGRKITEDLIVGESLIRAGTDVDIFIMAIHRDPRYFPDPLRFDPNRFLNENGAEDGVQSAARHPFAFIPFSAGPRNCIGQRFAMFEEKVMIASVLRRFICESLQPLDNVAVTAEMVLRPINGLPMRFTVRSMY